MKKIKYLFGIGLLGALFSTCFGANVTNSLSVFRNIGNSSPAVLASSLIRSENAVLFGNPGNYYFTGGNRTTLSSISSLSGGAFVSHSGIFSNLSTARFMQYDLAIQDGYNFSITGYYLDTSGNWLPLSVYNNTFSDIYGTFQVDYNIYEDFFPFAFKIGEGYFTLTDTTAIYNGIPYGITQYGTIQQCFYGLNYSFSCIYTDSNDNYNFVHYFYDTQRETAFELSGFVVIPLNEMTSYYNGTDNGSKTLILSFDSQNRIIYNIIDVFSDDINYLKSSNIIDRGYFDLSSLSFVKRYLLNSNSLSLGTTSEIFYDSGSYYYRSNIIKNTSSISSSYYNYCSSDVNRCFSKTGINLISDSSVIDILLGNLGNGNQSVGSIPLSSLYYQCLGPTYNTPDGLPPAWCLNPDGSLINLNDYKDCYFTINSDGSISESFYCSVGNIVQEMEWIQSGSGGYFSPCSGYNCSVDFIIGQSYINLDPVNNITTGLVLDMITNLTGWVGRCPFPYVDFGFGNTFKVFSYFKSLGYNIDPFLPLNCAIAGFHAGRYTIFEDLDLSIFNIPLLNGDTEKHKILFRFFDVLFIFAIFGIFRFFRKHI